MVKSDFLYYKSLILSIICLIFCQAAICQESNLTVLVNKIKTDYPSYEYRTKNFDFDAYVNTIKNTKNRDTFWMLSKIANFFNDMHLRIYDTEYSKGIDTLSCARNLKYITEYLNNPAIAKQSFEGYWLNDVNNCVIAVKQASVHPLTYEAYLIEYKGSLFPMGYISMKFEQTDEHNFDTRYVDPGVGYKVYIKTNFYNDSTIIMHPYFKWKKCAHYQFPLLPKVGTYSYKASAQLIDSNTFLITIPSCSRTNTRIVDSLVKANKQTIQKSQNLIVDIRNNYGGYINVYEPLLPFIYTNPIVRAGGYTYCVDDVIEDERNTILEMQNSGKDSTKISDEKKWLDTLIQNRGKFVWDAADTIRYDSVMSFPKHVALLTGFNDMSAAELMIFAFKQSKKVITFGEQTHGAVDHGDMYSLPLLSKKYILFMPSSRIVIPYHENERFDGIGIPPDVPINSDTTDWIAFVKNYYAKNH